MVAETTGTIPALMLGGSTYIGGVVTGLLAKSFERWWTNRSERRLLRNALYEELGLNFQSMVWHPQWLHSPPSNSWLASPFTVQEWERREVYDQALKSQAVLFHQVREVKFISQFYMSIERLKTSTPEQQMEGIKAIYNWFLAEAKNGKLSRRKLYSAVPCDDSPFRHPIRVFLSRRYCKITHRNVPKDRRGHLYAPSPTLRQKLKASWTGLPGECLDHELDVLPGRSPLGDEVVKGIRVDRS